MKPLSKDNLEEMFEQMGTEEAPVCDEHRYALRRKLLNSSYFNEHRTAMRRRAMLFVPVVASGFVVAVLFIASHTNPSVNPDSFAGAPLVSSGAISPDFLTDGLSATFVDGRPMIPVTYQPNTVLFSTKAMALKID